MALACAVAVGCKDNAAPTVPVVAPNPDMKIMHALDCYEPMYKVDANGRVTHLRLPWRHLPTAVLAEIGKLTELQAIELSGTTVTDEGLAQLADLQNLRSMSLVNTPITDGGLVHLEKLLSLQFVWLPKNRVTQAGVESLKRARPDMNVYLL
jgi:hypothetical protein